MKRLVGRVRSSAAPMIKTALMKARLYDAVRAVRPSRKLAILRYHAVCEPRFDGYAEPAICVAPGDFQEHVKYLAANYNVLSLPQAVASLRGGWALPPNAVCLTFDDGYADNLEAARMLASAGLSATFYITAGCIGGELPFWPAEIRALLAAISDPLVRLISGGRTIELALATRADRKLAVARLTRLFKSVRIEERERLRDQLRACARNPRPLQRVMLTWQELGEMQRLGMTIGAHTLTHPNLPSAGLEDAAREIVGSKQRLESELGEPVTMFSYPNGGAERYFTPELMQIVRDAGFDAATTSRNAFAGSGSDLYALERVSVSDRVEDLAFSLEVERFIFAPVNPALPQSSSAGRGSNHA